MEGYKDRKPVGIERYFVAMDEWLELEDDRNTKPLLIEAEDGVGKKMIIVKWVEHRLAENR